MSGNTKQVVKLACLAVWLVILSATSGCSSKQSRQNWQYAGQVDQYGGSH